MQRNNECCGIYRQFFFTRKPHGRKDVRGSVDESKKSVLKTIHFHYPRWQQQQQQNGGKGPKRNTTSDDARGTEPATHRVVKGRKGPSARVVVKVCMAYTTSKVVKFNLCRYIFNERGGRFSLTSSLSLRKAFLSIIFHI